MSCRFTVVTHPLLLRTAARGCVRTNIPRFLLYCSSMIYQAYRECTLNITGLLYGFVIYVNGKLILVALLPPTKQKERPETEGPNNIEWLNWFVSRFDCSGGYSYQISTSYRAAPGNAFILNYNESLIVINKLPALETGLVVRLHPRWYRLHIIFILMIHPIIMHTIVCLMCV